MSAPFTASLPNGIRLVGQCLPWAQTVSVGIWLDVGTKDERDDEAGLAHFLEHMLFKGTRRHTGRKIAQLIDALGGNIDAFTEKELTCFYLRVLPEHLRRGLRLIRELLTEPSLRPKDIEVEKSVVLAEIQSVEDTPEDLVGEVFFDALWDGHPLSRPILGTKESVARFRRATLLKFMRRYYAPQRMVIAAAGAVREGEFCEVVREIFGDWRRPDAVPSADMPPPNPLAQLRVVARDTEHFYFTIGVPSFPVTDPAHYPAALLDIIVGGGASSRLFMEVRERRGLAYAIGSFSAAFKQAGFFAISGSCVPEKATRLFRVIRNELRRLLKEGLRNGEMERAKTQLKLSLVTAQESVTGTMMRLGRQMLYFGHPIPMEDILRRVESVTEEEVLAIAHQLLRERPFAAAFVGPIPERDSEPLWAILNGD
ncbi:MAG: pitrilysin family protein [Armatimonadota bacterium]|jgi:predicted Zn-dependent peptidase|nr:pitrilysin family protein [Armatimonadota bacterium]MDT7972155.1 pitrilysin family protein [Armatimonadota bacterium]